MYSSVNLWVVNRSFTKNKSQVETCGVIESIEQVVLGLEGKDGRFVRYSRYYHRLHSPEEFSEILRGARKRRYYFFNNDTVGHGDPIRLTSIAPFIYLDEPEAFYW